MNILLSKENDCSQKKEDGLDESRIVTEIGATDEERVIEIQSDETDEEDTEGGHMG